MTSAVDRRKFLRRFGGLVPDRETVAAAAAALEVPVDWLGSEEAAMAQLSEARPFLLEDARAAGIDIAGKSELDILRELFARAGGPPASATSNTNPSGERGTS